MSFRKLLGIISIIIAVMFASMLSTSYAWYSFNNASTSFDVATNSDNIVVSYQTGEYISTNIAVPIASNQIDQYSEKNNFTIRVKENSIDNEMVATISLVDISIAGSLQNVNFKVDLYHQNKSVVSVPGNTIGTSGATTKTLGNVVLDDDIDNNFELRVYILDNGASQSAMMNKSFQAKIKINVVSRLKSSFKDYANADIYISSIMIDGVASDHLPVSGYHDMQASCTKGSNLSWDPISKTITYNSGSKIGDNCSLTFTTSDDPDYPLLSEMPVGSYVKYTGTNGCDGKHCEGQNANYVSDTNMGYCSDSNNKFYVNGWRIGYVENGSAYLISAGAPECVNTYIDSMSTGVGELTLSGYYYYGSGYVFNEVTGEFTLTGVTNSTLGWSSNYQNIINSTPYTCKKTSSTATCTELYEITEYYGTTSGKAYTHYNYDAVNGAPTHVANLDNKALKYCNPDYAYGGKCDINSARSMSATDFQKITGSPLNSSSCVGGYSSISCGYNNDLIDNGGYYWFTTTYSISSYRMFSWFPNDRSVNHISSNRLNGVRPVLYLESSVQVIGGTGTYDDPYLIQNVS